MLISKYKTQYNFENPNALKVQCLIEKPPKSLFCGLLKNSKRKRLHAIFIPKEKNQGMGTIGLANACFQQYKPNTVLNVSHLEFLMIFYFPKAGLLWRSTICRLHHLPHRPGPPATVLGACLMTWHLQCLDDSSIFEAAHSPGTSLGFSSRTLTLTQSARLQLITRTSSMLNNSCLQEQYQVINNTLLS